MKRNKNSFPIIHLLFVSLLPIISLYKQNSGELNSKDIFLPIAFLAAMSIGILLFVRLFEKNAHKAAMVTSLIILWFFSYESARVLFKELPIVSEIANRQRFFIPIWIMIIIIGIILILRLKQTSIIQQINKTFNYTAVFLFGFLTLGIVQPIIGREKKIRPIEIIPSQRNHFALNSEIIKKDSMPDVYYIILDAYASRQTLKEFYNYDNIDFLGKMQEKGFYIADRSTSNYGWTQLSMASSLNMVYLTDLFDSQVKNFDIKSLWQHVHNGEVVSLLKKAGYRYMTFSDLVDYRYYKSPFLILLLKSSMFNFLGVEYQAWIHWRMISEQLSALQVAPSIPGPKFVYAHLSCPHDPFVFDSSGKFTSMPHSNSSLLPLKKQYLEQLKYISYKTLDLVDSLIKNSSRTPIIIIQSDHGPWTSTNWSMDDSFYKERMRILNMYYVPIAIKNKLYDSITPVNTFRLVINEITGTQFPLLMDEVFWLPSIDRFFLNEPINVTKRITDK